MRFRQSRLSGALAGAIAAITTLSGPACAEVDLSGVWMIVYHEDWRELGTGPDIGDYAGMPVNEPARRRALAWHPSLINVPERQCQQLPMEYTDLWSNMRLTREYKPDTQELLAYHLHKEYQSVERTIWTDGRPHPSKHAAHSFGGFSTGVFKGDILEVTTTHLKEGYTRRNGLPRSDRATVIEHFIRHGDDLTISVITKDPVYMTEPRIRTSNYRVSLTRTLNPYPCEVVVEIASIGRGRIPSYFPWKNPDMHQFADKYRVPLETALGDARQMYPDFIK